MMETGPRYRNENEEFELQEYITGLTDENNALKDKLLRSEELLKDAIRAMEEVCACGHHSIAHYRFNSSPCVVCKCNAYRTIEILTGA